ncbi:MAG: PQQ-dependent sugar dehydrogenase, partial [Planctomycetota bacterium]|nr:PQQ-dependent sugar dehydrogenase [Planctomycetota bacterium]
ASPVDIASPPGDARIFVCEQNTGDLEIVHPNGTVTKFLDITGKVSTGGERGLLGVAFHPDYANNGRFFINYTRTNGNTRVEEYAVDPGNPDLADPNPVQTILIVPQPFSNHNGGCIRFGGDGMLYIGTGDGGSGNDPGNRAQDGQELLGKILRLDVDLPSPFIPADNPFVGDPNVLDEIWALGIRNPWRFSFDSQNGDLWIGDVGQNAREEIHWAPGTSTGGENYGWRCMEGFNCTGLSGCTCNGSALTDPAHDYTHGAGRCSVTGGIAYRGPIAGLQGTYFFADWCNGQIWSFDWDGASMSNFTERTAELEPPGADTIQSPVAFGEDVDGNMLILDHNGGELYVVLEDCAGPTNYCVTTANSETAGALISASGSVSLSANDMVLHASASVSNEFGLFFFGPQQQQVPAGHGTLCVDGGLVRIVPPSQADGNGMASRALNFNMSPTDNFSPGETMYFQWWYRDPSVGTGSNFSDGLCVTFCP